MPERKIVNVDLTIGSNGLTSTVTVDGRQLVVLKATVVVEKHAMTTIVLECLRPQVYGEGPLEPLVVKGRMILDEDSGDPAEVPSKQEFMGAIFGKQSTPAD